MNCRRCWEPMWQTSIYYTGARDLRCRCGFEKHFSWEGFLGTRRQDWFRVVGSF